MQQEDISSVSTLPLWVSVQAVSVLAGDTDYKAQQTSRQLHNQALKHKNLSLINTHKNSVTFLLFQIVYHKPIKLGDQWAFP